MEEKNELWVNIIYIFISNLAKEAMRERDRLTRTTTKRWRVLRQICFHFLANEAFHSHNSAKVSMMIPGWFSLYKMKSILFVFALPGEEEHFEMFPFSKSSLLLMMLIGSRTFEFSCFSDDSDWFLSLLEWREKALSHLKSKFEFFSFRSLRWWLQTHIFSHHQPMRRIHHYCNHIQWISPSVQEEIFIIQFSFDR